MAKNAKKEHVLKTESKKGIKFIYFDVRGPFARLFNDFGKEFVVVDKDGEEVKEKWIKEMRKTEDGKVEIETTEKHDLDELDKILILDDTEHGIEVVSPFIVKIEDKSVLEKYEGNGKVTQVKVPVAFKFKPLEE